MTFPLTEPDHRMLWLDGRFLPWSEATVPVMTHGLHYANVAFEGIRTYQGHAFRLDDHIDRLCYSARAIGLDLGRRPDELRSAAEELIEREDLSDAYIRPIALRAGTDLRLSVAGSVASVAIAGWPMPSTLWDRTPERGLSLRTSRWRRPSTDWLPSGVKVSSAYLISCLAKQESEHFGFDDAVLLDDRGLVSESTGANIFLGVGGRLVTPIPDSALDGITRQTVFALAGELGVRVESHQVTPADLYSADEIFITGTSWEIQAVTRVDDVDYAIGPLSTVIRTAYAAAVTKPDWRQP